MVYSPGDSAALFPLNDPHLVEKTIASFHSEPDAIISHPRSHQEMNLETFLTHYATITRFPTALLSLLWEYQKDPQKKAFLHNLLDPKNKQLLADFHTQHEIWDLSEELLCPEIPIEKIAQCLMPLLPRFYSITSSLKKHPGEVHLLVGLLSYTTSGHNRLGVASHYLCNLLHEKDLASLYIQPSHGFSLPDDPHADIIMIGSGTGLAPFSSFLQERQEIQALGKHWLFFGERNRSSDFYYQDFLQSLERRGFLRLSLAFSRDQEKKIYVQHRVAENAKEFFSWLEKGSYLYLCGDKALVKDVEAAIQKVLREEGSMSQEEAMLYLKQMRLDKRYRKDVY